VRSWALLALLALAVSLLWWRTRLERARLLAAWDTLARALSLGFDPGSLGIRGRYRLLRVELTARRTVLGLGPWRTRLSAVFEGVVPDGLALSASEAGLRASARDAEVLAGWLDAHRRREQVPPLLQGGVQVSGHTAGVELPGLLTNPEDLRALLGQLAELARLLSLR
jgi:hypothetical protein